MQNELKGKGVRKSVVIFFWAAAMLKLVKQQKLIVDH